MKTTGNWILQSGIFRAIESQVNINVESFIFYFLFECLLQLFCTGSLPDFASVLKPLENQKY